MQTNVYFYIDSSNPNYLKLFAAIDKDQKLLLSEKKEPNLWWPQNNEFPNLVEFITYLLNSNMLYDDLTNFILFHIFKLPS